MSYKEKLLKEVARKRQKSRWEGFNCLGDYHNEAYECDYVSPYTKSAHKLDANVMLVLQDWTSDDYLKECPLDKILIDKGHSPTLPTNKNLKKLLGDHLDLALKDTYATNLFPFIKMGAMSTPISPKYLKRAAIEFTRPQIEIIQPKVVICFGLATYNAVIHSFGFKPYKNISDAIETPTNISDEFTVFCQSHAGALGKANRNKGKVDRVYEDWQRMGALLKEF